MENRYLDLFKRIWDAPAGKQVVALLMLIPVGIYWLLNSWVTDLKSENKELKIELKEEKLAHEKDIKLYISCAEECSRKLLKVDSIHIAKFNDYRDKTEKELKQTSDKWEKDYRQAIEALVKAKRNNEKTSKELVKIR